MASVRVVSSQYPGRGDFMTRISSSAATRKNGMTGLPPYLVVQCIHTPFQVVSSNISNELYIAFVQHSRTASHGEIKHG